MKNILFYMTTLSLFVISFSTLNAEEVETSSMPQNGFMQTFIMIGIAVLFFYFILWRPEQKRRKALDEQRRSLGKGDKVTAMGIVGTVIKVQENTTILKMVDDNKIEVLTAAITDVQKGKEEKPQQAKETEG